MFKEIIATTLLLANKVNFDKPKQNAIATTQLYGTYVLRDDMQPYLQEFLENRNGQTGEYELDITPTEYYQGFEGLFFDSNNYLIGQFDRFYINLNVGSTYANCTYDFDVQITKEGRSNSITLSNVAWSSYDTLNEIRANGNYNWINNVSYHTLYISNYINLTNENYEIFNIFYTQRGNAYNTVYSGYYTFVNALTTSNYWNVKCQIIADNQLFNYWMFENGNHTYIYNAYDDYYDDKDIYDNGYKLKDMQVYINGTLPNFMYTKLNTIGTWGYVPQPIESYTFQDFFFSIIDTPLYFMWSMFNFDLFGVNLYIALTSLVTMCIVLLVIRKLL